MLKNSSLIKLPHSTTTIAEKTKTQLEIPRQRNVLVRPERFDRTTTTIAKPQQKRRIGQEALLIGTCSVAAAETQITIRENQVLKRNQLLAGIHCRRVLHVIFCIPSDARLESQAKPTTRAQAWIAHERPMRSDLTTIRTTAHLQQKREFAKQLCSSAHAASQRLRRRSPEAKTKC